MGIEPDVENARVYIVVGRAWPAAADTDDLTADEDDAVPVNVLLTAPDDETCIKRTLAALAGQGYGRAELDRVGVIEEEPEDPTFAAAYWNAVDGEVAVIAFHG